MGPGLTDDKTMLKGSKCFIVVLLLSISNFVFPVTGFALRSCRISYNIAICAKSDPKLKAVPRDIPRTVVGFDLSANNISKIEVWDFKNLSNLTQLDLNRNFISHIDTGAFHDLVSLKKLNLNNNRLANLGENLFDGLRNLTELRLNHNRMKVVASTFKCLTSLTFLDISNNRLQQVANVHSIIQHLPNLRTLYTWKNGFTTFRSWELTNSSLKQLTALDVSQNPFEVFEMTADIFPNLTWLNIGCSVRKPTKYDVRNKTFLSRVSTLEISGLHMMLKDMKTLLESVNSSLTSLKMNGMSSRDLVALINISCTIPTMSKLQLRRNNLKFVGSDLFRFCINVTELDLADNKINDTQNDAFRTIKGLRILTLSRNQLKFVPAAMRSLPTLVELDLSSNTISKLECQDFAGLTKLRQLNLYQNPISSLPNCVFKDLVQLQVLKLQSTKLSSLNGAFKKYLPNLRQLHLNGNELTTIKRGDFDGLQSLQNLSLHNNKIKEIKAGSFIKLTNLTDIQLQSNDFDEKVLNSFNDLINLRRLDLRDNHIHYKSDLALHYPPFSKLARLETLDLPGQHRRLKALLPRNFLEGLTNLVEFSCRNMQLLSLHKDTFNYTPGLQTLDISSNDIVDLSPELFSPLRNLKSLYVSRSTLRSLDFLTDANLTELEFLQARKNSYSVISEEVMKSLPALVYLDLQGNSFTCDCDNAWFLKWVKENNQTQVYDAYRFECNYPSELKGMKLLKLDVQSCSVAIEFICFVSTTCTVLLFMVASFTYHFLRLQLTYAYYLFLALLFDTKNKNKKAPNQYDAFISYNTHDEPWVIGEMLPKLEGEQGWRLCLHHRDFEPGRSIIDNITDAIYGSRKTICVISRRYLESEWCSKEIQVASFRLFDEQKDVLILVFLEDVPTTQLSPYHRMRKLLKRRTYLSWPRAEEHPELFWEKLRQALETGEDHRDDRFLLTVQDRQ